MECVSDDRRYGMVTRRSLARRVVFRRACDLRSDCVGAVKMSVVSV